MNHFEIGMLAKSKAGHDKDQLYVIMDMNSEYVYLVDGRIRTLDRPKKKKRIHVQIIHYKDVNIVDKIMNKSLMNEDIKRALKLYQSNDRNVNEV